MSKISIRYYKSAIGELILGEYQGKLCLCDWRYRARRDTIDKRILANLGASFTEKDSSVFDLTISQIEEYLSAGRNEFSIPIQFAGSDFQKSVWTELLKIPFGQTLTYTELTSRISDPEAIRAVASAVGANSISIIVPCHRIIGSQGDLTGYAGGIGTKKKLLKLEGALPDHGQLSIFPES